MEKNNYPDQLLHELKARVAELEGEQSGDKKALSEALWRERKQAERIAELEAELKEWGSKDYSAAFKIAALEKQVAELKALDKWNNSAAINKIKEERDALQSEVEALQKMLRHYER